MLIRIVWFSLLALCSAAHAQPDPAEAAVRRFRLLVQEAMKATGVPACSVAIVHQGKVVMLEGFGTAQAGPVTPDTIFQLASCSKPVTSTAIAALVGQGKLSFDSRVADLDPAFQLADAWVTGHLTLRDLLSHRSGLPGQAGNELEDLGFRQSDILHNLRAISLGDRFRTSYSYSNFGLTAAGEVAARAFGGTYAEMLDTLLFKPLGMTSSSGRNADFERAPNRALGHILEKGRAIQRYHRNPDAQAPAAGVTSTARDLSRLLLLHLGKGEVDGRRVVAADALTQTWQPVMNTGFNPATFSTGFYGLGWASTFDERGKLVVKHSGAFSTGSRSQLVLLPDQQLGVAILANAFPSGLPEALSEAFQKLYFGGQADLESVLALDREISQGMAAMVASSVGPKPARPSPPLPWPAYVGEYHNGYFGTVRVEAGSLKLGSATAALQPWDRDTFYWEANLSDGPLGTLVRFDVGADGKATALTLVQLDDWKTGRLGRGC